MQAVFVLACHGSHTCNKSWARIAPAMQPHFHSEVPPEFEGAQRRVFQACGKKGMYSAMQYYATIS